MITIPKPKLFYAGVVIAKQECHFYSRIRHLLNLGCNRFNLCPRASLI